MKGGGLPPNCATFNGRIGRDSLSGQLAYLLGYDGKLMQESADYRVRTMLQQDGFDCLLNTSLGNPNGHFAYTYKIPHPNLPQCIVYRPGTSDRLPATIDRFSLWTLARRVQREGSRD
jgi:hypothetical protein